MSKKKDVICSFVVLPGGSSMSKKKDVICSFALLSIGILFPTGFLFLFGSGLFSWVSLLPKTKIVSVEFLCYLVLALLFGAATVIFSVIVSRMASGITSALKAIRAHSWDEALGILKKEIERTPLSKEGMLR